MNRTSSGDMGKILVYGAGAIGSTVAGWLAKNGEDITMLARGQNASAIKSKGLLVYQGGRKNESEPVKVEVILDLNEMPAPDIIILAVKNYDLETAAKDIHHKIASNPIIIALQNGIENQKILANYFKRIIYGVVCFNAWREGPGIFGHQTKGKILFGVLDPSMKQNLETVVLKILKPAFSCESTDRLKDAVQCKIVINLVNSVTALIGHGVREVKDQELLRRIMVNTLCEGIQTLQMAGVTEVPLGDAPSWKTIRLGAKLPGFIANIIFKNNFKKMQITSMAQDLFVLHKDTTELDSINGYIVGLANTVGFDARFNKAIYEIAGREFNKPDYQPMEVADLWRKIEERIG
jgi:2-dehydropantoate 2-reductase